jgi:hypothetical protein
VTQEAAECAYTIDPARREDVPAAGGSYEVAVDATHDGCQWSASAAEIAWIDISPTSGSGDGTATVTVRRNNGDARYDQFLIAGVTHTVSQVAAIPTVTVRVVDIDARAVEGSDNNPNIGVYRISRTGSTASALRVNISMDGDAENGIDYEMISSPVRIGLNESYREIEVRAIDDSDDEPDESVRLTIDTSDNYSRGTPHQATITIIDNDEPPDITSPTVTITDPNEDTTVNRTPLTISGTVSDNVGVTSMRWYRRHGYTTTAGDCSLEDDGEWSASNISLGSGVNEITVSAWDAGENIGSATLTVTYEPLPDYTITDLSTSSSFVYTWVNVTYTVENQGSGSGEGCLDMAIYLSENEEITRAYDTELERWSLPSQECPLYPDEDYTEDEREIMIPEDTEAGYYYIGIIADWDRQEDEINEGNNTAAIRIYVDYLE